MRQRKPEFRDKRLYRRGRFIWCRIPGPSGRIVRETTRCTEESAASAFADELERRYADPRHAAAEEATLIGCVTALVEDMRRRGASAATIRIAGQKLGHFLRLWGEGLTMAEFEARGAQMVLAYIDQRQGEPGRGGGNVSDFTITKELAHLRQVLVLARYLGFYAGDPEILFPPTFRGGHTPRKRRLTADEFRALLGEFPPYRRAHLCFIAGTGARRSEAARACRVDVHLDEGFVHVRGTKTEAADDDVPITPITLPLVMAALREAPDFEDDSAPMFSPWGNLTRDLAAACTRAGIARCTPNDLRRSFGSWHRDAGVSAELVSKLLRHTTDKLAQTTYAKLQAPALRDLVARALGAVPDLYLRPVPGVPQLPPVAAENAENLEKSRATLGNRTPDLRFTKPFEESRSSRISRGTYVGAARSRVPHLYADSQNADGGGGFVGAEVPIASVDEPARDPAEENSGGRPGEHPGVSASPDASFAKTSEGGERVSLSPPVAGAGPSEEPAFTSPSDDASEGAHEAPGPAGGPLGEPAPLAGVLRALRALHCGPRELAAMGGAS